MLLRYEAGEDVLIVRCPHELVEGPWNFCTIEGYSGGVASISLSTPQARAMAEEILRLTEPEDD